MSRVNPDTFCRVSADTRRHLDQQAQNEQFARHFDPFDDALMHDICGNFAEPIQAILMSLHAIELTEHSFGVDKEKAFDQIRPLIEKLRDACRKEFEAL